MKIFLSRAHLKEGAIYLLNFEKSKMLMVKIITYLKPYTVDHIEKGFFFHSHKLVIHGWWEGSRSNYKKEQQNPLKYYSNLNGSYYKWIKSKNFAEGKVKNYFNYKSFFSNFLISKITKESKISLKCHYLKYFIYFSLNKIFQFGLFLMTKLSIIMIYCSKVVVLFFGF